MAKICNRRNKELGAEVITIFPGAQVGRPAFVKAVKDPCPWASIMQTGGVSPTKENLNGLKRGFIVWGLDQRSSLKRKMAFMIMQQLLKHWQKPFKL